MNKTLFGLALISYYWENNKKDIIDSYIPLVCNIILNKAYNKISRDNLQENFNDDYGIAIPLGACESILKRMSKDGLLDKQTGEWIVNHNKVSNLIRHDKRIELDSAFSELINDLINYSVDEFNADFSKNEFEEGIIAFFKEYDLDLLFANNNGKSILPQVKESKKIKYIIAKFITELQNTSPSKFKVVLQLAKGYAVASLITYEDIREFSGNLKKVDIYLDAPIVFNLLGLNGISNLNLSLELIGALSSNDANLRIFEFNYGEVIKTIQDAIIRLNSKNYDIAKSSRVLKTAIRENISAQQLQLKLNQIEDMFKSRLILKVESPVLDKNDYKYQIDENILTKEIEHLYKRDETQKTPSHIADKIERDVKAISNIFKIRKHNFAYSLKSSRAILLTSNEQIAFAAKNYERNEWQYKSVIPVCVTDVFLSTILWANYPTQNENLNIRQLISDCYNIIELDNRLLKKFYDDIHRMHNENSITDEQFFLLSASNLTYSLLEQKTFNDIEEYTDKTPAEILEDIQIQNEKELFLEKEKLSKIGNKIRSFAKKIARSIFYFIAFTIIIFSIWLKSKSIITDSFFLNILILIISILISVFGYLRWMEIIPSKLKIEAIIEDYIFNKLNNWLNN